jgi:hypothetical protein
LFRGKMDVVQPYWNSFDRNDVIPNSNPYIFSNDTLTIVLFLENTWQQTYFF